MQYDRRTAKIARYWPIVANGALGQPISIQVALTDSCFNRCIGCGHPLRVQRKMTAAQWLTFITGLDRVESVCYSGGDPMAFREFNAVMHWHLDAKVAYGMTITGYVPPYIDMDLMRQAAWVRVSLDAVTPEVYEKVRGATPVYKVLESIDAMLAAGVNVSLGVTLHPDNEDEYANVQAYATAKGITDVEARYAYPNSNPRWPDATLEQRGVLPFNNCHAALYQLYIDSDGSVYPCCITAGDTRDGPTAYSLGNIFTQPWPEIWQTVCEYSKLDIRLLPDVCRTCCVQRLSEINHVCGTMPQGQSFF